MPRVNAEHDYIMYMHPGGRIHGTAIHTTKRFCMFLLTVSLLHYNFTASLHIHFRFQIRT